ncbi:M24 family metallopeptidase [Paenibacillus planticolens]|uniref:M24 family metallopeptidase n=1 Tax=Paenibacillus planticolens TaxID=2654976 RepID=A0ABX1ZH96_9BACL|nr:Xaa-Pro peptidase family protein [Paenibacillus planticolens]NOU99468.1 M24 family metallopeptidase [Paenibacillus planticolens]
MNVFTDRVKKCLQLMQGAEIGHLLVSSKYNMYYLTGQAINTGERLSCLLLDLNAPPKLIIHEMFVGQLTLPQGIELLVWKDEDDPIRLLGSCLRNKVLGVDQSWPSHFLIDTMSLKPSLEIRKSTVVEKLREIKDAEEIQILQQSSRIADAVMHQVIQLQHLPATEMQVAETIRSFFGEHQVSELSFKPIIGFGRNSANPHHELGDTVLLPDQAVVIDMGGLFRHYCSDITRTLFYGKPNSRFEEIYKIVQFAQEQAISLVKPGVSFAEIDLSIRREFTKWGYDRYFTHRTGHGLGLELHEGPFLHRNNQDEIQEGMVFSVEPGIYLPDEFGIRIEDIVAVTSNGCELLTRSPKEVTYFDIH